MTTGAPGAAPAPSPASAPAAPAPSPTPSSSPSPAPSSSPAPSPDRGIDVEAEAMAIFRNDPFKDGGLTPSAAPQEPASPAAAPAPTQTPGVPPQAQPPASPAAPAAPTAAPQVSPEVAQLRQTVAQLQDTIARMNPPQGGQPGAQPGGGPDVEVPPYAFEIPDPLVGALNSEDPVERKRAIGSLIQGTAQGIHRTVVQSMRAEFGRVLPYLVQNMMQQHQVSRTVHDDFYGKYPQLNHPDIKPLVQRVGASVAQETGIQGYSEQFRDMVAQRVLAIMGQGFGAPPAPPASTPHPMGHPAPVAPAAPPAMMPPLARPPVGPAPQNEIMDLIR